VAVDDVIDVVAMRYRFVAAVGVMDMVGYVSAAVVSRLAGIGIGTADSQEMLIDMIAVNVMQMAFVQIIGVAVMLNGGVAAVGAVLMIVIVVFFAGHGSAPLERGGLRENNLLTLLTAAILMPRALFHNKEAQV
jgi:hypothetical protein